MIDDEGTGVNPCSVCKTLCWVFKDPYLRQPDGLFKLTEGYMCSDCIQQHNIKISEDIGDML